MAALFRNGRFFQSAPGPLKGDKRGHHFAGSIAVSSETGKILYVGTSAQSAQAMKASGFRSEVIERIDLEGRIVLPGFIDGHMHLLMLGQSLQKAGLELCQSLDDIRRVIREYAAANPHLERIMCKGWMHFMTDGKALASMLDDLDLDTPGSSTGRCPRPIFIDSKDLHSVWCNTSALKELGVYDPDSCPDPEGGRIHRNPGTGFATGLLEESAAVSIVWPHISKMAPMEEKLAALRGAIEAYNGAGYTGAIEMAMDENAWEALQLLRAQEAPLPLSVRFAVHWLITPRKTTAENLAQVDRAIELNAKYNATTSPDCRVVGIKIIGDGIVDGCTASLTEPYTSNGLCPDPIWSLADLAPVVRKADAAGLQVAIHAIGDRTVCTAIDALEQNSTPGHRHRIEHLELASPADAKRLGKLGITASIQPVHADPSILRAWSSLLGPARCERAFAYRDFLEGGAVLALGSDAPTAPHSPLKNIYTATTRKSAREPDLTARTTADFALALSAAVAAATEGSAYSCFAEARAGRLDVGLSADFVIVDMEWDADELLQARVVQTWFMGRKVFDASSS